MRDAVQQSGLGNGVTLRPEYRLLVACAATHRLPDRQEEIDALVRGPLDWRLVLETARAQRVVALCYPALQEFCRAEVPADVMAAFRAEGIATAARNLRLAAKLLEITERADAENIAMVPYKGPVLAAMAYGNLGLREFVDLDFIVPHRDLHGTWGLLKQLGYRPVNMSLTVPETLVRDEYVFLSEGNRVQVEVRTELTLRHFPALPDLDSLLAAREAVTVAGRSVMTFSREDTLTLLSVHGAKDFWAELLWICDIARLVQAPDFDWGKAINRANGMGCRRMTNVALLLAHETLGATIPDNVLKAAEADAEARAQAQWVVGRLFAFEPLGLREQFRYRMRMVEGFWPGMRYVVRLATAPAADDWNTLRLPAALGFAYFLLRPLRLLRRRKG